MSWLETHTSAKALASYHVICVVPVEGGYFALALANPGDEAIFAFDKDPIAGVPQALSFGGPGTPDWGFAYDRNGDGNIDAFFFLVGAGAFETPEIAERLSHLPTSSGKPTSLDSEEGKLLRENIRLIFNLYADDNFDGQVDALVVAMQDPERPIWYYRRAVLRSRVFTQVVDDTWTFAADIDAGIGPVPQTAEGWVINPRHPITKPLEGTSKMLVAINTALHQCRSAATGPLLLPSGPPDAGG